MRKHFRVHNLLLTMNSAALTLTPVDWFKDHPIETEKVGGEDVPKMLPCEPDDEGASPWEPGGKMTEVRVDETEFKPGDYVTLDLTLSPWKGYSPDPA